MSATFNSGYDRHVNDDDYGSGETFSYDVGAGHTTQTLDTTTVACVTVTAPDGSTSDI